jgi:hypothetical protein
MQLNIKPGCWLLALPTVAFFDLRSIAKEVAKVGCWLLVAGTGHKYNFINNI